MADSGDKPTGFTVNDRRAFDPSGERKEAGPETAQSPPPSAAAPTEPQAEPAADAKRDPQRPLPPADFATLVLSLGSSAAMYLGEGAEGGKPERNLPMAKHAIDLLTVLEDKTKGNLSSDEEHILESLLFDLRLRYVEALKGSPAGA
jgi:hypothetical protein